jgi:hypothetical protein
MYALRFVISVLVVLVLSGAVLDAQRKPLDRTAIQASARPLGDWKNVDPTSRGLLRIVVDRTSIHPYWSCAETTCDWGRIRTQSFASQVEAQDTVALLATLDDRVARRVITLMLEADGRLKVQTFSHFTDGSKRSDYVETDYFTGQ